ncbi:MAG: CDP-glycerol glycerophosphotransferase family protein [Candidatus Ancillula sp.]|jgi:CDP-glycerol glycerophosphotransferase (TagB/SpsB family)|nr:CDP-glycerol glycerophosphotransferase family protein [Candidatus Ancillula sp.]
MRIFTKDRFRRLFRAARRQIQTLILVLLIILLLGKGYEFLPIIFSLPIIAWVRYANNHVKYIRVCGISKNKINKVDYPSNIFKIGSIVFFIYVFCSYFLVLPAMVLWIISFFTLFLILAFSVKAVYNLLEYAKENGNQKELDYLSGLKIDFALFYQDGAKNSEHQLKMWYPYFKEFAEKNNKKFAIITYNNNYYEVFSNEYGEEVAVVRAPSLRMMGEVLEATKESLKAIFYVNNSTINSMMIGQGLNVNHIQLLHGDSDKPSSYSKVTTMFDYIFVAGQAGADRYYQHGINVNKDKFKIVGRPQIGDLKVIDKAKPVQTILFAPTWRGNSKVAEVSSLEQGEEIVKQLVSAGLRVIFRPHPYTNRDHLLDLQQQKVKALLEEDNKNRKEEDKHIFGELAEQIWGVNECTDNSDAVIGDLSSVLSDYLYSGKPILMVSSDEDKQQFVEDNPFARTAYIVENDLSNLSQTLKTLKKNDPMFEERQVLKHSYIGTDINGFFKQVSEVIK